MKATITAEHPMQHVTSVLLIHPNGLQIRITPGRRGFIVEPGVPVTPIQFERWERLAWEVVADDE